MTRVASFLIANQAIVSGLGVLFWWLATHAYPTTSVGQSTSLLAAAAFVGLAANVGLPYAVVFFIGRAENPAMVVRTGFRIAGSSGLALSTAAVLLVPIWSPELAPLLLDPVYSLLFILFATSLSLEAVVEQALVAAGRPGFTTAMFSIFALIRLPFPVLGAHVDSRDLVAAWAIAMGVAVAATWWILLPIALRSVAAGTEKFDAKVLLGYGAGNHLYTLIAQAPTLMLPVVIINSVGGSPGATATAHFYVAMQIATLLYSVPVAIGLGQFAEGARSNLNQAKNLRRALAWGYALIVSGILVIALFAETLLLFFGPNYARGNTGVLIVLSVAAAALLPESVFATRLRLARRFLPLSLSAALASGIAIVGGALVVRSAGLEGVAWMFVAGHAIGALALMAAGAGKGEPPAGTAAVGSRPFDPASASPSGPPGVAVVILNWNAGEHLARCVGSVCATAPRGTRIIVIDNASKDGSLEAVESAHPSVEIHRNGENLGFAGAYNRAIESAPEEFIVLLNPDIIADNPGWVESFQAVAEADPKVVAVACRLVFADDPKRLNSAGGMAYWWTGPVDIGFGEPNDDSYLRSHHPFAASGGAMLVRRSAFLEAGGFDERMFAYVEDLDLCWRMRLRGLKIGFASDVVFRHVFGGTMERLAPHRIYLTHRNFLRAMLKNYSAPTLARALPSYALWTLAKAGGALFFERSLSLAMAPMRALGWNAVVLRDTLERRRKEQSLRTIPDAEILALMGPRGFEPLSNFRRRLEIAKGSSLGGAQ